MIFNAKPWFASLALISLSLLPSCKTAEFKSVPNTRNIPKPTGSPELIAEPTVTPAGPKVDEKIENSNITGSSSELRSTDEWKEENFFQEDVVGIADILVVIDDSNSMIEEQTNLSTKMDSLLISLKKTDWRIGVITTSTKLNGSEYACDLKLIKATDSDAKAKFAKAINAGVLGSDNEQGILQAVNGLKCPEQPWVRDNSTLAVLIVSDEDNCSNGLGCPRSVAKTESYLIDYVESDLGRVVGKDTGFYGIYSPPSAVCRSAPNPAFVYQNLIDYRMREHQNYGNICDSSYQNTLERISKNIASLLKKTFELKETPRKDALQVIGVKANGQEIQPSDYELIDKRISFNWSSEPKPGTGIKVRYKVQKEP